MLQEAGRWRRTWRSLTAATWVQITRLYMPDAGQEIELVAHLPKK